MSNTPTPPKQYYYHPDYGILQGKDGDFFKVEDALAYAKACRFDEQQYIIDQLGTLAKDTPLLEAIAALRSKMRVERLQLRAEAAEPAPAGVGAWNARTAAAAVAQAVAVLEARAQGQVHAGGEIHLYCAEMLRSAAKQIEKLTKD